MLSDLAPLEMSAPELADARLSGVGSAQTPLRLAQLLPVRSREDDTYARQDKTSSRDELGPDDAFSPHSPRFLPHVLHSLLFSEKCICYRPAAAVAETETFAALVPDVHGVRQSPCVMMMWAKAETRACLNAPLFLW